MTSGSTYCLRLAVFLGCTLCCRSVVAADLLTIYQQALQRDPIYQQSVHRLSAMREQKPQAMAPLFPSINLTANTHGRLQSISSQGFGESGDIDYNLHGYKLSLSQTLFNFNQYLGLNLADTQILLAELEQQLAMQELMVRVAGHYFDVLAKHDNLEFARAEKNSLERQLTEAQQNFDVGLIPITDVQEARAGYDLSVASEILAVNEYDNAREALHEITNQYPDTLAPLADDMPLVKPEPADIDHWTEAALENNLQVIAAKHSRELARQQIDIHNSEYYPVLNLITEYDYSRSGGRFGTTRGHTTGIGLEFSMPLFQGGITSSRVRAAQAMHSEADSQFEQQRRQARRLTREAYLGVLSGISQVHALKQAVVSSESALRATRSGFDVGTRTAVDVVVAERGASSARRDYARARYDYALGILHLRQAVGSLVPRDLLYVNAWLDEPE